MLNLNILFLPLLSMTLCEVPSMTASGEAGGGKDARLIKRSEARGECVWDGARGESGKVRIGEGLNS